MGTYHYVFLCLNFIYTNEDISHKYAHAHTQVEKAKITYNRTENTENLNHRNLEKTKSDGDDQ